MTFPPSDAEGRALPAVGDEEQRLAEHIGRVAMMASALDASLAALVGVKTEHMMSAWGLSGEALADLVEQFDPDTAGRYREVYTRRNHAIHALHTEAGAMRQLRVTKRNRHILEDPARGMELIDQSPVDFPLLIGIWYDMQSLRWEAQMAFLRVMFPDQ